jgi:hypothetical protein
MKVALVVNIDTDGLSPREVRQAFAQALRDAIQRARAKRRIDAAQAEELWRVVPDPEHA